MADEKFHYSSGEILIQEVFLFFLFGRKDIVHDCKLLCLKKSGKKKCEISSQWHFNRVSIKGRSRVDQVSIKGVDQHMTTAAFSTHYPEKSNPKLTTYTSVARYTGN